ncbi:hypothetical protein [Actinocrispum wychmicini]|uniref:PLL-like beta propeller domain-containing protein n=1 Tax=Actinocrispum wychmicini TaxID=1213861 RepID=A0A4R2JBE7_9PSEU|nr:hypothetical protein [Actinocrispum wychmicini]TCO55697.1 hypothetical protein EV192_107119 [Actinocrispum wychmicini]
MTADAVAFHAATLAVEPEPCRRTILTAVRMVRREQTLFEGDDCMAWIKSMRRARQTLVMIIMVTSGFVTSVSAAQATGTRNVPPSCNGPAYNSPINKGSYGGLQRCGQYSSHVDEQNATIQVLAGSDYKIYEGTTELSSQAQRSGEHDTTCVYRDPNGNEILIICAYGCATLHWLDGRKSLFCVGSDHGVYYTEQFVPGGPWTGWRPMGGYATSSVTVNGDNTWRPQIVVYGSDQVTRYERHWTGSTWSPWAVLSTPG